MNLMSHSCLMIASTTTSTSAHTSVFICLLNNLPGAWPEILRPGRPKPRMRIIRPANHAARPFGKILGLRPLFRKDGISSCPGERCNSARGGHSRARKPSPPRRCRPTLPAGCSRSRHCGPGRP